MLGYTRQHKTLENQPVDIVKLGLLACRPSQVSGGHASDCKLSRSNLMVWYAEGSR